MHQIRAVVPRLYQIAHSSRGPDRKTSNDPQITLQQGQAWLLLVRLLRQIPTVERFKLLQHGSELRSITCSQEQPSDRKNGGIKHHFSETICKATDHSGRMHSCNIHRFEGYRIGNEFRIRQRALREYVIRFFLRLDTLQCFSIISNTAIFDPARTVAIDHSDGTRALEDWEEVTYGRALGPGIYGRTSFWLFTTAYIPTLLPD